MKKDFLCIDCGKYFSLRRKDVIQYKKQGKKIPCHCPDCRNYNWLTERKHKQQIKKYSFRMEKQYE